MPWAPSLSERLRTRSTESCRRAPQLRWNEQEKQTNDMVKKLKAPKTVLKTTPKKTATASNTGRSASRCETPSLDDLKIKITMDPSLTDDDFAALLSEEAAAPEATPYRIFPTKTVEGLADGILKNLRKREGSIVSAAPGTGARVAALVAADRQVLQRNAGIVLIAAPACLVQHWRHVLKTLNATFSVHKAVPAKWVDHAPVIVVPFPDFRKDAELLCREVKPKLLIVDGALGLAGNGSDWDDVVLFALSGIPVVALDAAGGFDRAAADVRARILKAVAPKVKLPKLDRNPEPEDADAEAFEDALNEALKPRLVRADWTGLTRPALGLDLDETPGFVPMFAELNTSPRAKTRSAAAPRTSAKAAQASLFDDGGLFGAIEDDAPPPPSKTPNTPKGKLLIELLSELTAAGKLAMVLTGDARTAEELKLWAWKAVGKPVKALEVKSVEGAWREELKALAEGARDAGAACVLRVDAGAAVPSWEVGDDAPLFDDRFVILDHDLWRARVESGEDPEVSGLFAGIAAVKPVTELLTQNRGEEYGVFERLVGAEARAGRRLLAD